MRKALIAIGVALALALGWVFLLVGEPAEEVKYAEKTVEETISTPMQPMEALSGSLRSVTEPFGEPVLSLYGVNFTKASVSDTAYGGGWARVVTIRYPLSEGGELRAVSIRPTSAAPLLKEGSGWKLVGSTIYSIADRDAARMENGTECIIFTQTDTAVYALIAPAGYEEEMISLLRSTTIE